MHFPQGLNILDTVVVESPAHLAEVLADASARDIPVVPVGGGTCLSTGLPTDHPYRALDLGRLTGIENYIPTDMTASFLAGTPIRDVTAALAENGQELPIDLAPDDSGTIGGLVATGYSGARRFGQGTLKDLLIGCEYVRGDGLFAKAGGMTVKNVSGFEISRVLHGSWGSLAVLTRVNLKVLPRPKSDRTFTWHDSTLAAALDRQLRLLSAFPGCIALETTGGGEDWGTSIRFVGREPAMKDYELQLTNAEGQPDGVLDAWPRSPSTGDRAYLVANNPVAQCQALALTLRSREGVGGLSVSLPTGTVRAELDTARISADDITHDATGLWMIEGGDPAWKHGVAVWGESRGDNGVSQSIKHQFDPANVLNRGRLFI